MTARTIDIFTPTEEHALLRKTVRKLTEEEVEPGALARDANEQFDPLLFKKLGDLGLLGITAPEEYGGSGRGALIFVPCLRCARCCLRTTLHELNRQV